MGYALVISMMANALSLMASSMAFLNIFLVIIPVVITLAFVQMAEGFSDMKNLWRVSCLGVFVTGIIAFSQTQAKQENKIEPAVPYTVITADFRRNSDGGKSIVGNRIRYVKSDGEWRQMPYDPQNDTASNDQANIYKETAVFANTEDGVVAKAPGYPEKKFISKSPDQQMQECFRSVKCLSKQLTFVRKDVIAGLEVYVLRTEPNDPASPIEWIEESFSPRTGYIPLRIVRHFRDGSEIGSEATKVEFRDVPENLNDDLKALPVKGQNKN